MLVTVRNWVVAAIVWAAAAAPLVLGLIVSAKAHDFYPYNCCSGFDCRAVSQDDLSATDKGWLVKSSGEVVPYGDQRIKVTPPEGGGLFHLCTEGGRADGRVICIYIPNFVG